MATKLVRYGLTVLGIGTALAAGTGIVHTALAQESPGTRLEARDHDRDARPDLDRRAERDADRRDGDYDAYRRDGDRDDAYRRGDDVRRTGDGAPAALAPRDLLARLEAEGITDVRDMELDHGRYEVEGRDADGRPVKLYLDAATGERLRRGDDD